MAGDVLRLKVTEERYTQTLQNLDHQLGRLQTVKKNLETARGTLERSYKGEEVKDLIQASKNYEKRADDAIQDVTQKKEKILSYLEGQRNASTEAATKYGDELRKSAQPFA